MPRLCIHWPLSASSRGVGDGRFAPDRAITRAEFTVIAMRFADLDTSGENIFTDVNAGDWFYDPGGWLDPVWLDQRL